MSQLKALVLIAVAIVVVVAVVALPVEEYPGRPASIWRSKVLKYVGHEASL